MSERWGSVDGDTNADAILSDRRRDRRSVGWVTAAFGLVFMGVAAYYGYSGDRWALALALVLGVFAVNGSLTLELHRLETWMMITERRAQLLEQALSRVEFEVGETGRRLR